MAYESVNSQWPEGTHDGSDLKPTPQEAITAAKLLYRFVMKRKFRGRVKLTSGWRYTTIRGGVMYVNPDCRKYGWHELVHDLSHYFCSRLYPNAKGHGHQHAFLEREMIAHVVKHGWLDGKLRKQRAAKPDPKQARYQRAQAAVARWESKLKRAETALRKSRSKVRYYERTGIAA